jgi:hypothetical protein
MLYENIIKKICFCASTFAIFAPSSSTANPVLSMLSEDLTL